MSIKKTIRLTIVNPEAQTKIGKNKEISELKKPVNRLARFRFAG